MTAAARLLDTRDPRTLPFGRERPFAELLILGVSLAVGRQGFFPICRILGIALSLHVFVV
jgi:hypothetical protein